MWTDDDGNELPRLVYVFREKRLRFNLYNQDGAMNSLVNGEELGGCSIKHCRPHKGFIIYSIENPLNKDGIMVVPVDLAITPMRVLQDPLMGSRSQALIQEGEVDDCFLVVLFLIADLLRYLDVLPRNFGNPLWFAETELAELIGTTLYKASLQQSTFPF